MKLPIMIDFEGLDCSFKETNSKRLASFLNTKRYEFPYYASENSYFIRQYLSGKYKDIDINTPIMIAYLMEMFDEWNTKIIPDIKNGLDVIIFDRFWYSNYYYQCKTTRDRIALQILVNELGLPKCDIIFKMMTNFDITIKKIREKNDKDILESDEEKMKEVHSRFETCKFNGVNNVEEIYTYNGNEFRSEDEIFEDITTRYFEVHKTLLDK